MAQFMPLLLAALNKPEESGIFRAAVGTCSDIARVLTTAIQPYCDQIMTSLVAAIQNENVSRDVKPAVLAAFGDIAMALGNGYEKYLKFSASILYQASQTPMDTDDQDLIDYHNELRSNIIDSYAGILNGLVDGGIHQRLLEVAVAEPQPGQPGQRVVVVQGILQFLQVLSAEEHNDEEVLKGAVGMVGDLAQYFGPQIAQYLKQDFVAKLLAVFANKARETNDPAYAQTLGYAQEKLQQLP